MVRTSATTHLESISHPNIQKLASTYFIKALYCHSDFISELQVYIDKFVVFQRIYLNIYYLNMVYINPIIGLKTAVHNFTHAT